MILYNDFAPFEKITWGASDTETFTYIDGEKVTNEQLKQLGKTKNIAWFREHATVRVWAWQFSDGIHFFVTNDFDEYILFLCEHKIKAVWYYNAKFDFAQIDYQLLTHNPVYTINNGEKSKPYTYNSLHNDMGGRFSLKIWTPYKHSGTGSKRVDRHKHVHAVTIYDFCNIFGGGLARLLKEFNVKDFEGNEIRKSTMDYQGVDEFALSESDMQYLKNDTIGLYHLIRIANETLKELTGYEIAKAKPDVMTAGGLAKRVLLSYLYPNKTTPRDRIKAFQYDHPLTIEQDHYIREHKLYGGGVCALNTKYMGRLIHKPMYRYDVNSEYPFIMSTMPDIIGNGKKCKISEWHKMTAEFKKNHICILIIENFRSKIKTNYIPIWRNPFTHEYTATNIIDDTFLMYEKEFIELQKWYDIDYYAPTCIIYETRQNKGYANFVNTFYKLKAQSKKEHKPIMTAFAKLLLNSSYGKLAERCERNITFREINLETGAVHLVKSLETEEDNNGMLSVLQGALVTSMARCWILSHIREICHENPLKNFVYCDTDSVHCFTQYNKSDAYNLGGFKDESPQGGFNCIKYIAPKCYFDGLKKGKNIEFIEFHTKGLNVNMVIDEFTRQENGQLKYKSLSYISKRFNYGQKYQPLSALNIKGGKALIPIDKYLAKPLDGFIWNGHEYIEA